MLNVRKLSIDGVSRETGGGPYMLGLYNTRRALPLLMFRFHVVGYVVHLERLIKWPGSSLHLWQLWLHKFESVETAKWRVLRNRWISVLYGQHTRINFLCGGAIGRKRSKPRYKRGKYRIPASNYPLCIYRRRREKNGLIPFNLRDKKGFLAI